MTSRIHFSSQWARFLAFYYGNNHRRNTFFHRFLLFFHRFLLFFHRYLLFFHRYLLFFHKYLLFFHRYYFSFTVFEDLGKFWSKNLLFEIFHAMSCKNFWHERDSNPGPLNSQARALPNSYQRITEDCTFLKDLFIQLAQIK